MNAACLVFALHAVQAGRVGCAVCFALWGAWRLLAIGRRLGGTTLQGAWLWAFFGWLALSLVEIPRWWAPDSVAPWLAYAAVALAVCPVIALLGAKRPQHRGWPWVVLSLWVVLILPALEAWLRAEDAVSLDGLRAVFLAALVGMGLCSGLGTRHATAALAGAVGQAALLAPHLSWFGSEVDSLWETASKVIGWLLCGGALLLAGDYGLPGRAARDQPWQRAWRDFRDSYGLFWSLRLAERFNLDGRRSGWQQRLMLRGFVVSDDPHAPLLGEPPPPAARRNFDNLLRRFVDARWLAQRWPADIGAEQAAQTAGSSEARAANPEAGPSDREPTD